VREVIRHIQIMRKEANFDVDDRIILSNNFSDDIMNAIEKHKQYFMNEILCTDIVDKLENSDYNSVFSYEKNNFNIFIKKQKNR
jgi:isoleucyl-tRNA synthetase